ncbi:MAG: mechanosensitive ion channel family protein, partial [Proteobacteria bacterium]|nr:mechanosensitive ion channel family protein [Pseudomonadota bacterium]
FTLPHMPKAGTDMDMEEGGGHTRNRLETLMPLLRATLLTALVIMVAMISLSAFGVNIGPLLAGAGVVGIAIGFGAQKLVADVIAGVFFLIDDAFRVGEYVDTGSVKGTVEKISIRSLQLRHHRGALHTIPFGEIRHLTNYHRDWAIVKMEFRVPYNTDVEKVRKIIKKEGQEMLLDERFAQTMLAPLKSQGVARMEDSAMIIRAKFTAVPGEQFVMRREAYRRIQQALQANGIEFAHRKVTVEFPDREMEIELDDDEKRAIGAAADAAVSAQEIPAAAAADSR